MKELLDGLRQLLSSADDLIVIAEDSSYPTLKHTVLRDIDSIYSDIADLLALVSAAE
jgi:hypothetical protein